MESVRHVLSTGQRLYWQARAGQYVEVCRGRVEIGETLWLEGQLLHSRQRLGPGSCYVAHSDGWVSLTGVSGAELRLPPVAAPVARAPSFRWRLTWRNLASWLHRMHSLWPPRSPAR